MNILVTGASGFIGKNLIDFLTQKGHFVKGLSSSDVNLASSDSVDNFISSNKTTFDVIVHGAFILCDSSQKMQSQMQSFKENIEITENIVKIAQAMRPKKFINLSSMAVYPNIDGTFSETSEIRPSVNTDNMYGLGKFCAENIIDTFLSSAQIFISHLRIGQVYGLGMRDDRIFPVLKKELAEQNTITLFGNGQRVSAFIEVAQLVYVINCFIENEYKGIYNLSAVNLAYTELASQIIKKYGNESSRIILEPNGLRSKFILNCDKLLTIIDKGILYECNC